MFYLNLLIFVSILSRWQPILANIYEVHADQNIINTDKTILIENFGPIPNKLRCLIRCNQLIECIYVSFQLNTCRLYSGSATKYFSYLKNNNLFKKKAQDGLVNHWKIFDSNTKDIINGADLYDPVNADFTTDRFNVPNSAIKLTNGYYKIPPGVYISGTYSITAWAKVNRIRFYSRLIDLGNGLSKDEVLVCLSSDRTGKFLSGFVGTDMTTYLITSAEQLQNGVWNHLATVVNTTHIIIYVNGTIKQSGVINSIPNNIIRNSNFVGRSNWDASVGYGDENAEAEIDEIKIFNRPLTELEILSDYLN